MLKNLCVLAAYTPHSKTYYMKNLVLLFFIFCCTIILLPKNSFAQPSGTGDIRGFVYDKETGEPVIFTNVYLEGTTYGGATDINGLYSISRVPAGSYTLMCTYVGYDTTRISIDVKSGDIINQKLFLSELSIELDELVITSEKEEKTSEVRISTIKITPKQMGKIPAIGGEPDLAQYLQVLPGVVFTGDQGGQLYIRGGSQIQTKVLLDGMTIYNPFHSIGLFSVFETDLIKNVEVVTGGFNATYSGRISAVIDVATKDGNKKRHTGKVAANTFLAKAILEGPIMKLKDDGNGTSASYLVTAKSSYLDRTSPIFYSYVDSSGLPYSFTDLYGKLSLNTASGSKLNFSGYRYVDDAAFQGQSTYGWDSWGLGSSFVIVPDQNKMIIDGFFSFSQYNMLLQEGNENRPRTSSIGGFNGGMRFTYFLPKGDIKYGIDVSGFATQFSFENQTPKFVINQDQYTTEMGGFFKYRSELADKRILFEPSVRINYYASLPTFTFEPRLGMKINATKNLRFKFSSGLYTQNFISTKSDRDVVNLFTGFLSGPDETLEDIEGEDVADNLQKSFHAIGGVEMDLGKHFDLNMETYYKNFGQLININRNKLFPSDPNYIVERGRAYGFDALLKYDYKRLFAWVVYSLSFVDRNDGVQVYPPHFDRRHNVNFLSSYKLGKDMSWEISARWNLGSGFPFTKTQGFYEELDLTQSIDADYLTQNGSLGILYDETLNGGRLPYYHRFDLSMKKAWEISKHSTLEFNASVTNVYNRQNIFYFDRVRYERVNQLPILPSAGVSFTF